MNALPGSAKTTYLAVVSVFAPFWPSFWLPSARCRPRFCRQPQSPAAATKVTSRQAPSPPQRGPRQGSRHALFSAFDRQQQNLSLSKSWSAVLPLAFTDLARQFVRILASGLPPSQNRKHCIDMRCQQHTGSCAMAPRTAWNCGALMDGANQ